jgi:hypothetical protein
MSDNTADEKNKSMIGDILVEFIMLEEMLGFVIPNSNEIKERTFKNRVDEFCNYIDNLDINGICRSQSTDKIFCGLKGKPISLRELLFGIYNVRNIAAHQTYQLVIGLTDRPIKGRNGIFRNCYAGTASKLHSEWKKLSEQLSTLYNMLNSHGSQILNYFDINGEQIAEWN